MHNPLLHRLTLIPKAIRLYVWTLRLGVTDFPAFFHDYRLIEQSGFFWSSEYLQNLAAHVSGCPDPITHYLAVGSKKGLDPNPLFDSQYYLSENPEVAESGSNPLAHYLAHGARERRNPHPLFDSQYYLEHYGHLLTEDTNPLADFIDNGGLQGRHPSLSFDTTYYLQTNPNVGRENVIPLSHYLRHGSAEGKDRWDAYSMFVNNRAWSKVRYDRAKEHISNFDYTPVFSILMPVYNAPEKWLRRAIESVLDQIYPHWELCIADDRSTTDHVRNVLEEFSSTNDRIRVTYREQSGHIAAASNTALNMATGDFVTLLDHDDELEDTALFENARLLNNHPDADMIYSDEDKIDENGLRYHPFFKPDWSPDTLLSQMYSSHLSVYRKDLINTVGGFRTGYDGSQDYDLALRISETPARIHHIPKVLYHWRSGDDSTASNPQAKEYAHAAAVKALEDSINRRGESGTVKRVPNYPGYYIVDYVSEREPKVSVIIPTQARPKQFDFLNKCLESILEHTAYDNYEIIVVGDRDANTELLQLENHSKAAHGKNLKLVCSSHSSGLPALVNEGVHTADGEIIALINDSMTINHPDWLGKMVGQASRKSIGAVGGLILKDTQRVLSAGLTLVPGHPPIDSHKNFSCNRLGVYGRLATPMNCAAIRSSFLVVQRLLLERHGALNEKLNFTDAGIDFCLWLLQSGFYNLLLPHVRVVQNDLKHDQELTAGDRPYNDMASLEQRWGRYFDHDPYYNENLTKKYGNYRIDTDFLPASLQKQMKVWL